MRSTKTEKPKFKSDCQIHMKITDSGKSNKFTAQIYLKDKSGKAHITASKYLGKCKERVAYTVAAQLGLELADSLKKRNVEIFVEENRFQVFLQEQLARRAKVVKEAEKQLKILLGQFKEIRISQGVLEVPEQLS